MTMYNETVKNDYLKQFTTDTQEVYKRIFKNSEVLEDLNKKDLYSFEDELLEKLILEYIKPKTKQSARTYCSIMSNYIDWAIHNNYRKTSNPLKGNQEYFYSFVDDQNNLYFAKSELDDIVFTLMNAQDSFIIQGLFYGIQGSQVSELTNLTRKQVDEAINNDNIIVLVDGKGKERAIKLDKATLELAKMAHKEPEYYKKNGAVDYSENIKEVVALPKSDYILKPTATNKDGEGRKISHFTVYNRLEMLKSLEEFEEYKDAFTTKNIVRSGMLYEAKKILDSGRELDRWSIEEICEKYGIKFRWSLKDFLNEETVREVYSHELALV